MGECTSVCVSVSACVYPSSMYTCVQANHLLHELLAMCMDTTMSKICTYVSKICTQGISVYELIISCMNYWLGYVHECHCGQTTNPNKLNKFLYRGLFRTGYLTPLKLYECFYFCELIILGVRRTPVIYKPVQ